MLVTPASHFGHCISVCSGLIMNRMMITMTIDTDIITS